jgi:hypothetical protein
MLEKIGGYINEAYGWEIVQHGDLVSGIEMRAPGALRPDHLEKTVFLFTKDGYIGQGNFLDVFLSFLPDEP